MKNAGTTKTFEVCLELYYSYEMKLEQEKEMREKQYMVQGEATFAKLDEAIEATQIQTTLQVRLFCGRSNNYRWLSISKSIISSSSRAYLHLRKTEKGFWRSKCEPYRYSFSLHPKNHRSKKSKRQRMTTRTISELANGVPLPWRPLLEVALRFIT